MKEISWDDALELASPYPYVLVTTLDSTGKPNVIGLGWWMITSWQPQMVAVAIGKNRYSHECIEYCKEFVLCFPSEELKSAAWYCGTHSGRDVDKFKETDLVALPANKVKPPRIDKATVSYECSVEERLDTGDHTLYIGKVLAIHGNPDKAKHLYSVHYTKLVSIDSAGNVNFDL